jgi:cytochrome c-type biogenesis protein CcmH/NrfG
VPTALPPAVDPDLPAQALELSCHVGNQSHLERRRCFFDGRPVASRLVRPFCAFLALAHVLLDVWGGMARRTNRRHTAKPAVLDPLRRRCSKLAARGDLRKAAAAAREVVARDRDGAAWVRLGVLLARAGRLDAALDAFKQGQFLHRRAGFPRRADIVAHLMEAAQTGGSLRLAA